MKGWLSSVAVCGLALMAGLSWGAGGASASPGGPFEITKFTMQTTHAIVRKEPNEIAVENVPYTFTQAGGHPWALTTTVQFASEELHSNHPLFPHIVIPVQDPKNVTVYLPPGLLGNPLAVPQCPLSWMLSTNGRCNGDTQIGVARLRFFGGKEELTPIVNVTPEMGQSAEFALESGVPILETGHLVRTAQGYGFAVFSDDIPASELVEAEQTFWGVPADPSHDPLRGLTCLQTYATEALCQPGVGTHHNLYEGGESAGIAPVPFLTWPTDCTAGPEKVAIRGDSWEEPATYVEGPPVVFPGVTGCDLVQFIAGTGIEVKPTTTQADTPVELGVDLKMPQVETPGTLTAPPLRDTRVTLPQGMSVSPGVVDGVQACNEFGPEGINITGPESEAPGLNDELQLAPGHCPDDSTVGTAEAVTPLLPVPVRGHVYLARPGCGGAGQPACTERDALDGNLYKLYLELGGTGEYANTGIEFKVPLDVQADPATGQLTTVVQNIMQAPVSEVKIRLNGGPRGSVDNPAVCGAATTSADFTPWSAPGTTPEGLLMAGTPDALSSSFYTVDGCFDPVPFNPGFVAGTVTPNAGQFSSFTLDLSRPDREQFLKGVQVHTPPGLLAMLSSVPLCNEAQADDPASYGECPAASKIGTSRVASGAGSHPFEIEGSIYLTGPHDGAPFGLSIVTHAVAGPFNLGLVVVRARIEIDPNDSSAVITTDETGPHALPQIVFGVPLRLKRVTVKIDRHRFMFNPTNCAQQRITGRISGSDNTVTSVSSPFAVGNCNSLSFKPSFKAWTSGRTSRRKGASLAVKLSYPRSAMGKQANIAKVKVSLPRALPSYVETLNKACLAATFDMNPAKCPGGSVVGIAKASTPLLPSVLEGPVYFVSHGGEEFPSLIVVLQGDGVRVDLTGSTFIEKGITSSTFKTVPDVPVNTFELYLPQGTDHALAANRDLCKMAGRLKMPTVFTAQNGKTLRQNTNIQVTGCAGKLARHAKRAHAHKGRTGR